MDPLLVKRAQLTAATSTAVESLRQCQAVLLPALFGATLEQTAQVLGVGRATVARLQAAFRKQTSVGPAAARNWGGRRQSLLTPEEEVAFQKRVLDEKSTEVVDHVAASAAIAASRSCSGDPTSSVTDEPSA